MGIGSVGIDANEQESMYSHSPEPTNIDEVVNFYFEIRKYLFPSQPVSLKCDTDISEIKTQSPPILIPPPNSS
jgi:hypothetical protein